MALTPCARIWTCHDSQQIGDTIGTTRDGGDTPILLFSIVGGAWPTPMF